MPKPASVCRNKDESSLNWLTLKQSVLWKFCDATSPGWIHPERSAWVPHVGSAIKGAQIFQQQLSLACLAPLALLLCVRQQKLEAVGKAAWRSLGAAFAVPCVDQQPLHSPAVALLVAPRQEIPKLQLLKLLRGLSTPSPLCMFLPNHLQSQGISGRKDSQ